MPILDLSTIESREIIPGYFVKFIHSDSMTIAHWEIKAGNAMPDHSHHHEQVVNLIQGEFQLILNNEVKTLTPGMVVVIPPDVPHAGKAITDCSIIDVFHPVREDYL